ncbi:MAG TPA: cation:proton antiporter [Longimicrobiales bacterium]|nr:cation:proton antiporter [Longimicrobiales bacterium]
MIELLALTGIVVLVSALASGPFERRGISLVLLFLLLGLVVGPYGIGIANYQLTSSRLQLVAVVSLTMVLFSDAVSLSPTQLRSNARLAALILGPGTLVTTAIIALAAWKLLGLSAASSTMLGAALASTDPVLLRSVIRNPRVAEPIRQALRLESGLNDAVLLPIILIAAAIAIAGEANTAVIARTIANVLIVGPVVGVAIGLLCVYALDKVRGSFGMRRDYESLYTIGVAFTAFAAAEALHTSGYLAAFTAGLAISFRDVELCDCFHDYGEATAEAALLLTFLALGGSLIWTGFEQVDLARALFVVIALATRPIVLLLAVHGCGLSRRDVGLLAWFGPRGLSSLLLILVPVFAGVPDSAELFAICSLVVVVSIVIHGASPALLARESPRNERSPDRITLEEMQALDHVTVLDVRTERSFESDELMAANAIRVNPDYAVEEVRRLGLPRDAWLALYCT